MDTSERHQRDENRIYLRKCRQKRLEEEEKYGYRVPETKDYRKGTTKTEQIHATYDPLYDTKTRLKPHKNLIE